MATDMIVSIVICAVFVLAMICVVCRYEDCTDDLENNRQTTILPVSQLQIQPPSESKQTTTLQATTLQATTV